jgi:hypothetical protein
MIEAFIAIGYAFLMTTVFYLIYQVGSCLGVDPR